jgi:hypothetical protein
MQNLTLDLESLVVESFIASEYAIIVDPGGGTGCEPCPPPPVESKMCSYTCCC